MFVFLILIVSKIIRRKVRSILKSVSEKLKNIENLLPIIFN